MLISRSLLLGLRKMFFEFGCCRFHDGSTTGASSHAGKRSRKKTFWQLHRITAIDIHLPQLIHKEDSRWPTAKLWPNESENVLASQGRTSKRRKMFRWALAFWLNGNMLVGVWKESPDLPPWPRTKGNEALKEPHVKEFDITGRAMKGWVLVASEGLEGKTAARVD